MQDLLQSMRKKHDYLVCIDSDGCVFDNMELKHKECFCPATVNVWDMQSVSRFAREAADYVNLYSIHRGINRFPGLILTLELTAGRPEVQARGWQLPDLSALKRWIANTDKLSMLVLEDYIKQTGSREESLRRALDWSREVDDNVRRIVRHLSPFPYVKDTLEKLSRVADIVVVSAASHEAVTREWGACGLSDYVSVLCGQELGTKAECIQKAMQGRYDAGHVLKIGDAPGDFEAAKRNGVLFFPILPGQETESWQTLLDTAADRFLADDYRGPFMDKKIQTFFASLLTAPPWQNP